MQFEDLDTEQRQAVEACLDPQRRVVPITGPAGTGKTSIMRLAVATLRDAGYTVALAAPTGKAAKRIKEATGFDAMTVHRLLEYSHPGERDPNTGKVMGISQPKRDHRNPLEVDYVFVDEYAMVNNELHRNIFDALPAGGKIRVFGDVNQLQPIEPNKRLAMEPSPFEMLLNKFAGVTLVTNHRQGRGSGIAENGKRILLGQMPSRRDDFAIHASTEIGERTPVRILESLIMDALDAGIDYGSLEHQVITPGHKSWVGTVALNTLLHNMLSKHEGKGMPIPRHQWDKSHCTLYVGDKVVCNQNIYDICAVGSDEVGVFNGETGIVTELSEYGEVTIDLGDRVVVFPPLIEYVQRDADGNVTARKAFDPRKDLAHAYALTTHKMQGSECKHGIYILNKSHGPLLCRPNFYTGVSRMREMVHVIMDSRGISMALSRRQAII
jgi:exodeoxyribonuclease V alpha subunit